MENKIKKLSRKNCDYDVKIYTILCQDRKIMLIFGFFMLGYKLYAFSFFMPSGTPEIVKIINGFLYLSHGD